ncbi:hypothetical protein GQ53DRAFT_177572 [Thozetella sp. PMI_491]|nr:hypothetical protein GQ53DRAFT_177572 [Thozetella sp. PMI_491]
MSDWEDIDEDDGGLPLDDCFDSDRFLPQMDLHVVGPSWIERRAEANLTIGNLPPALPPSDPLVAMYYCDTCSLTWLRGFNGEKHTHPLHNAVDRDAGGPGRALRTAVIWLGAAAAPNKTTYSAYFGPGSRYNIAGPYAGPEASGLNALLQAGEHALGALKNSVLPDVVRLLKQHNASGEEDGSDVHLRVLLATDSDFLVDNICDAFHDTTKLPLAVVEKFDDLYADLEDLGIELQWYLVPKEENLEANSLAEGA